MRLRSRFAILTLVLASLAAGADQCGDIVSLFAGGTESQVEATGSLDMARSRIDKALEAATETGFAKKQNDALLGEMTSFYNRVGISCKKIRVPSRRKQVEALELNFEKAAPGDPFID